MPSAAWRMGLVPRSARAGSARTSGRGWLVAAAVALAATAILHARLRRRSRQRGRRGSVLFEPSGAISKTGRRSRRARRPSSFPKGPSKSQGLGYDTVVKRLRRRARTLDKATLHRIFKDIASLHIKSDAHDNADTISFSEWREVCETALQLDVRDAELQRLWARMTRDQTGVPVQERELGFEAFARGASTLTFLQQVVSASLEGPARDFKVPDDYDYSTYTNANYGVSDEPRQFFGEFQDIRATRDYSYHVNYTRDRQLWQDAVIKSTVVRTEPQVQPWIVYTCGPMGAGKGYTLSWMSRHGFFPLENIVHIDPDHFKSCMPEWAEYVRRGDNAGDLCHRESGYIQEIAQEVAMRARQNVWVDGSLRDGAWFSQVFKDIRGRFPHYKIAIFEVSVPGDVVRQRVAERAAQTGRYISDAAVKSSLRAVAESLAILTPLCDFVARIDNTTVPILKAYETVDHSGNWGKIKSRFASMFPTPGEFPEGLAPLSLRKVDLTLTDGQPLLRVTNPQLLSKWNWTKLIEADLVPEALSSAVCTRQHVNMLAQVIGSRHLVMSPAHPVNLDPASRLAAGIPATAVAFAFCYPALHIDWPKVREVGLDTHNPVSRLVLAGGFVYFDVHKQICGINAVMDVGVGDDKAARDADNASVDDNVMGAQCGTVTPASMLQFEVPAQLPAESVRYLVAQGRFRAVTLAALLRKGATHFAWIKPGEEVPGMLPPTDEGAHVAGDPGAPRLGAFAYIFHALHEEPTEEDCYFLVLSVHV